MRLAGDSHGEHAPSRAGDGLLDVPAIAALLQVNAATVYRLLRDQRLPGLRVGGQWRFRRDEIEGWLTRRGAGA